MGTELYKAGSDDKIKTGAELKEALAKGEKIYTETKTNGQTDANLAKKNKRLCIRN